MEHQASKCPPSTPYDAERELESPVVDFAIRSLNCVSVPVKSTHGGAVPAQPWIVVEHWRVQFTTVVATPNRHTRESSQRISPWSWNRLDILFTHRWQGDFTAFCGAITVIRHVGLFTFWAYSHFCFSSLILLSGGCLVAWCLD
jgi:hypothetical protein